MKAVFIEASYICRLMEAAKQPYERVEQKERTRQKLLAAARGLVDEGETLTITRAAKRAGVADATAYRYYANPRALLRDALSIDWRGLEGLIAELVALSDPADRAQRAAEEMARFVLEREISIRTLFAATDQEPRDRTVRSGLPQTSFRRRLVDAVLSGATDLPEAVIRQIELGLIVTISPHAVLTIRDAMAFQTAEIPARLGQVARSLFSAAAR